MNRFLPIALSSLFLSPCAVVHGAEVVITNPDTPVASGNKMGDAKKVAELRLSSGNGLLVATVKTPGPQFIKVAGETAVVTGKLFGLAFDSDNDNSSGGSPAFATSVKGIEREAAIEMCAEAKANPDEPQCMNGFWGNDLAGAHASVIVRDVVDKASEEVRFEGGKVTAKDEAIRVEIPYARLGVSAGGKVLVYLLGSQANGVYGPLGEAVTVELD